MSKASCPTCSAKISSTSVAQGRRRRHIVYNIEVSSEDGYHWIVPRRYREFRRLHQAVVGKCAPAPFPSPSIKDFCGHLDVDFVEARRLALQTYLCRLLDAQPCGLSLGLADFLKAHLRTLAGMFGGGVSFEHTRRSAVLEEAASRATSRTASRAASRASSREASREASFASRASSCEDDGASREPHRRWSQLAPSSAGSQDDGAAGRSSGCAAGRSSGRERSREPPPPQRAERSAQPGLEQQAGQIRSLPTKAHDGRGPVHKGVWTPCRSRAGSVDSTITGGSSDIATPGRSCLLGSTVSEAYGLSA